MRSLATLITTVVLSLLVTSCGITPSKQEDMKAELEKVKGPNPGSIEESLKSQAEQAAKQGEFKRSSEMYKQLIDRVPGNADYLAALSETLRRSNDCPGALQYADQAIAIKATNAVALENKGLCLMEKGDFANAAKALGEALKQDNKRWRSLNGIGIIFAMKSRFDDSLAYYNAALAITPDNPSILNNKGLTLAMDKRFDEALKAFEDARDHCKNNAFQTQQIDMNIALVYAIEGKLDEAEQTASPHLSKEALYNNMGFYAYLAKNSELARSYLNMALTESPVYYERAWNNLGALNGDNSSETSPSLEELKNAASEQLKLDREAPQAKGAAGIMLDDIPVSKPAGNQPGQ